MNPKWTTLTSSAIDRLMSIDYYFYISLRALSILHKGDPYGQAHPRDILHTLLSIKTKEGYEQEAT